MGSGPSRRRRTMKARGQDRARLRLAAAVAGIGTGLLLAPFRGVQWSAVAVRAVVRTLADMGADPIRVRSWICGSRSRMHRHTVVREADTVATTGLRAPM